jgi:hemoglobin
MNSCNPHDHHVHVTAHEEIPEGAVRFACLCSADERLQAGDAVRWLESFTDLTFPPVPFPSRRVHDIAGTELLRALVRRHHVRLRETEVGTLFPDEARHFMMAVEKTADFVVEACGGPDLFTPANGPMRMRHRHFHVAIDERAREIWLRELLATFDDVAFPAEVREEYWNWMEPFSIRMITRRTTKDQPRRHPYAGAKVSLEQATACREA